MTRSTLVAILLVLAVGLVPVGAHAQSDVGSPLGSLWYSASSTYYERFLNTPALTPFTFYIVSDVDYSDIGAPEQNETNGVYAYEAAFHLDPEMVILRTTYHPAGSVDVGSSPGDYIVGPGGVQISGGEPLLLISLDALLLSPKTDLYLLPVEVSKPTIPGTLAWVEYLRINGCVNRLTGLPSRCIRPWASVEGMVINCTDEPACRAIEVETSSWGSLKGRF